MLLTLFCSFHVSKRPLMPRIVDMDFLSAESTVIGHTQSTDPARARTDAAKRRNCACCNCEQRIREREGAKHPLCLSSLLDFWLLLVLVFTPHPFRSTFLSPALPLSPLPLYSSASSRISFTSHQGSVLLRQAVFNHNI
jgi:hypothetical protein